MGNSKGAGLWFASPQRKEILAGTLGIWPAEKENSHRVILSPGEKVFS